MKKQNRVRGNISTDTTNGQVKKRLPSAVPYFPDRPSREPGMENAHAALEYIVPEIVAAIWTVNEAYHEAMQGATAFEKTVAEGLTSLAHTASCRLQTEFPLAREEWRKAQEAQPPVMPPAEPKKHRSARTKQSIEAQYASFSPEELEELALWLQDRARQLLALAARRSGGLTSAL